MREPRTPEPGSPRPHRAAVAVAVAAAVLTGVQAATVALTGAELCVGQGCALVGRLTRLPPALFNLVGCAVFAAVAALAWRARRPGGGGAGAVLPVLLAGAWAAEGVLFAYQWHVAGAWCTYCLVVLAAVAALNVLCSGRRAAYGAAGFVATATIFSLLSFVPFNRTIADGMVAVRPGQGGPAVYLIFSEDCPHCREVENALEQLPRCTVRYNPVARVSDDLLPGLDRRPGYDPRVNLAVATLLGLETVPILLAEEYGGFRVINGTEAILDYLSGMCGDEPEATPLPLIGAPAAPGASLFGGDDGCGIQVDCDE